MLTVAQALMFRDKMAEQYKANLYDKERSIAMIAGAGVLAFGGMSPKDFLENFSTTIPDPESVIANPLAPRSAIYLSKTARENPDGLAVTVTHECHHAFAQQKGWPESTWFYAVSDHDRAEEEVQAYVIGESVSRRLLGFRRSQIEVQASLDKSYHLGDSAKRLTHPLLKGAWMALDEGLIPPSEVAIFAHSLLDLLGVPFLR